MKILLPAVFGFFLFCSFDGNCQIEDKSFDKSSFYKAYASDDTVRINQTINLLNKVKGTEAQGYVGAITMKKSGLVRSPKVKLKLFKLESVKNYSILKFFGTKKLKN